MNKLIENGIPSPQFGCGEIIQTNIQLLPPSDQDQPIEDHLHSSEESLNSCEEQTNNFNQISLQKKRIKLKVRSISDSTDDEVGSTYFSHKGILKNVSSRRLRSLSESCAENYSSNSYSTHGESGSALDDWCEEDELDEDGEEGENQKVKKTVRFSDVVRKQLFRSNSSILGQRKKNQRRSRNKSKKNHTTTPVENSPMGSCTEREHTMEDGVSDDLNDALESITLCDSGIEVEDSDHGTNQQRIPNPTPKKNKKNRAKNNRRRAHSESSSNEMIFDLDL